MHGVPTGPRGTMPKPHVCRGLCGLAELQHSLLPANDVRAGYGRTVILELEMPQLSGDRWEDRQRIPTSSNPSTLNAHPNFPPAASQYVSQYHRWTLPHRMRTLRVHVHSLTRLLGDQLLVQSTTHTPSWLQIN
ncbi:hypothetical protein AB1N83_000116 [Pleurotus pulmonarius]